MKLKAKRSDFKGAKVLAVGYCNFQALLSHRQPFAYLSGVYGWNSDLYDMGAFYLSTGYSPIGKHIDCEIITKYEKKAEQLKDAYRLKNYDERSRALENLISLFIEEVKGLL